MRGRIQSYSWYFWIPFESLEAQSFWLRFLKKMLHLQTSVVSLEWFFHVYPLSHFVLGSWEYAQIYLTKKRPDIQFNKQKPRLKQDYSGMIGIPFSPEIQSENCMCWEVAKATKVDGTKVTSKHTENPEIIWRTPLYSISD